MLPVIAISITLDDYCIIQQKSGLSYLSTGIGTKVGVVVYSLELALRELHKILGPAEMCRYGQEMWHILQLDEYMHDHGLDAWPRDENIDQGGLVR